MMIRALLAALVVLGATVSGETSASEDAVVCTVLEQEIRTWL